ncbi:MAG: CHAT domain-containing protein [Chloroflexia bacterium]
MTAAFLHAGAASLVVSLWHASDEATARLMQAFYRNLSQGQRKSAALRAAQLELRATEEFRAPFYWAPFVLYGNAGPLPI